LILGGAAAAGACYFGWTTPAQIAATAQKMEKVVEKQVKLAALPLLKALDKDADGDIDIEDSKLVLSQIGKKHGSLAAGFAGGLVAGYTLG